MQVTQGNLDKKIALSGPEEFNTIAESFNTMAAELNDSFYQLEANRVYLDLEQKKLSAIVACIAEGLFVTDNDSIIISFNKSAEKITGYSKEEVLGSKCGQVFKSTLCTDACALSHAGDTLENIETSLITKEGFLIPVAVSSAILMDQKGNPIGGVQSFRDITEEKKRHELYCRTEKMAALGQLAAGVAHEINNPLGNIIGYAKMIKPGENQEKIDQRLEVIVEQARKCSDIVKGLLDYSRSSISEPAKIDINKTVKQVVAVLQLQLNKKNIHVSLDLTKLPLVLADSRKLEQLILNLVLNASQAVDDEGQIKLKTWSDKNMVHLSVQDNGPGVPDDLRCRIFDPFFTTKPVGKGTGLGLSICVGIIEEIGGMLELDNTSEGACFIISLPMAKTEDNPMSSPKKNSAENINV